MKYSIIIPAFNASKTIESCLQSVAAQVFSDFEAIVINDGSTDNTADICRQFSEKDPRIRYLYHDNHGVSFTRNRGIDHATGDFLLFLDSDDTYSPDYLLEFDRIISKNPEFDNIWCGYKTINEIDLSTNFSLFETSVTILVKKRSDLSEFRERVLDAALWNKAFKSKIVKENKIYMREDISLGEDILFNYTYLDKAKNDILFINKPLYNYKKASNNTLDSKYRSDLKEIYDIVDNEIIYYFQKWEVNNELMSNFYNSIFYSQERVLRNTYRAECNLSSKEKRKYNQKIISSEKFQNAFAKSSCYIHPLYRFAYRLKSWNLIRLLDGLSKVKYKFISK